MGRPPELATMTSSSSVEPDASPDTHIASCNPFDALEACVGPAWSLHDTSSSARRSSVDDLPPNFRELLDELKSRCRSMEIPMGLCINDDVEHTYKRFLIARKFDVDKAYEMLHNAVQWRAAHGVDDWRATPCDPTTLRDLRRMIPTNPCFAYSKDDGIPIMIQRVGQGDAKIATKYLPDKHVFFHVLRMEFATDVLFREATKTSGRTIAKDITWIDLKGLGINSLKCLSVFSAINSACGANYPERSSKIFLLNAPRIFSTVWSAVKQLIDPRTQKKIQVFSGGKKQLEALERVLDIEDIPEFFGGKFAGPWDGDAVAPSARFAMDPADRSKSMWQRTDEWVQRNHARLMGLEDGPLSPTSWVHKQRQMARTSEELSLPDTRCNSLSRGREPHPATPLLEQVAMHETTFDSVLGGAEGEQVPASFWAASATAEEGEEERAETMFTRAPRGYTDGEDTLTGCEMTLSCGVHELHAILFGPQSTLDAQLAAATNVTLSAVSTWRCNAHGLPQRKVRAMVPVVGETGALARLQEVQRYTVHQPGRLYVIHSTTTMLDVPFGGRFEVDTQYVLMALPRDSQTDAPVSYLRVTHLVRVLQDTLLHGFLSRNTLEGLQQQSAIFRKTLTTGGLVSVHTDHTPRPEGGRRRQRASTIISLRVNAAEPTEGRTLMLLAAGLLMLPEALECVGVAGRAAAWVLPGLAIALCWWAIVVLNDVFRRPTTPPRAIS